MRRASGAGVDAARTASARARLSGRLDSSGPSASVCPTISTAKRGPAAAASASSSRSVVASAGHGAVLPRQRSRGAAREQRRRRFDGGDRSALGRVSAAVGIEAAHAGDERRQRVAPRRSTPTARRRSRDSTPSSSVERHAGRRLQHASRARASTIDGSSAWYGAQRPSTSSADEAGAGEQRAADRAPADRAGR